MRLPTRILGPLLLAVLFAASAQAVPLQLHHQGRLLDASDVPVSGPQDMTFSIYDLPAGGTALWSETQLGVPVGPDGLFTVLLGSVTPLPAPIFDGRTLYLGVQVAPDPEMAPRAPLVSSPYSLKSAQVEGFSSGPNNSTTGLHIVVGGDSNSVVGDYGVAFGVGNQVEPINQADTVFDTSAAPARTVGYFDATSVFPFGGGAVLSGGSNTAFGFNSVVAGGCFNDASAGLSAIGGGYDNDVLAPAWMGTIAGGRRNRVHDRYGFVGGGTLNEAGPGAVAAGVGGGVRNLANGRFSWVGGGAFNQATLDFGTVGGGRDNASLDQYATVGGGFKNAAAAIRATVGGGEGNAAANPYATVGGGISNVAGGDYAVIAGGSNNSSSGRYAAIGGGHTNSTLADYATVAGGLDNNAVSDYSSILGGSGNAANGLYAFIGGGQNNSTAADLTTVGGGLMNAAGGRLSTSVGGQGNSSPGDFAFTGGGQNHQNAAMWGTIAGGSNNATVGLIAPTIGGGEANRAYNNWATVGGGFTNLASGLAATVPGGHECEASGDYSFASGWRAKAVDTCSFVWADCCIIPGSLIQPPLYSARPRTFNVRATGGFFFYTDCDSMFMPGLAGVQLPSGGSAWTTMSSRDSKDNIVAVDAAELLEKVASLPVYRWNYKAQDESVQHIGPMAQDFRATFGVGDDSTTISTIDPDGIALAAIGELYRQNQKLAAKAALVDALQAELIRTNARLDELSGLVRTLSEERDPARATGDLARSR